MGSFCYKVFGCNKKINTNEKKDKLLNKSDNNQQKSSNSKDFNEFSGESTDDIEKHKSIINKKWL